MRIRTVHPTTTSRDSGSSGGDPGRIEKRGPCNNPPPQDGGFFSCAAFAFRTRCGGGAAAGILRLSYGASVIKVLLMLNRSVLVRSAFIGLLLVGLVVLADSVVRQQLERAAGDVAQVSATAVVHTTGAIQ